MVRWGRALGPPLGVLAMVAVSAAFVPPRIAPAIGEPALRAVWLPTEVAALTWLLTSATRAALQPARDHRAFERLHDLRVRAGLPDHVLLCIVRTVWSTPGGSRAHAVDIRTGESLDLWLAEAHMSAGSFALMKRCSGAMLLMDAIAPGPVLAAQRHERRLGEHRSRQRAAAIAALPRA